MSESTPEHATHAGTSDIKKFAHGNGGKVAIIAVGGIIGYLVLRRFTGGASASPSTDATQASDSGTSEASGSGGTGSNTPVSPIQSLQDWFASTESSGIASDPTHASLIDATLADIENGVALTPTEQQEWQKLLSQVGSPPQPIGGQGDLYSNPIVANGSAPSNTNLLVTSGGVAGGVTGIDLSSVVGGITASPPQYAATTPAPAPVAKPAAATSPTAGLKLVTNQAALAALPKGTNLYTSNGQLIANPAALKALPKGTNLYTK